MVDEDFVMGYVLGYNDAGGGSGSKTEHPIFQNKRWQFGDSGYYVALSDLNDPRYDVINNICFKKSLYTDADSGIYSDYGRIYRQGYHVFYKGNNIIGAVPQGSYSNTGVSYSVDSSGELTQSTVYTLTGLTADRTERISGNRTYVEYKFHAASSYKTTYYTGSDPYETAVTEDAMIYQSEFYPASGQSRAASQVYTSGYGGSWVSAAAYAELLEVLSKFPELIEEVQI